MQPTANSDTAGMHAREPLLACHGVSKYFGALAAVKNLDFSVAPGEVLGIGGPNGAGKTSLFEVISGLNPATSGRVELEGRDITRLSPEHICHAGIARTFQLNAVFESLTVRENVEACAHFGRANRFFPGLRLDREARRLSDEVLEVVGLAGRGDEPADNLPVIDRKRLMIASALVTEPKLLLMDEPVGGLTPGEIDDILALIHRLHQRGLSIIVIEHVMRFLIDISSRVMIMHHGEKIYEGEPRSLVHDSAVIEVYLGKGAAASLAAAYGDVHGQ